MKKIISIFGFFLLFLITHIYAEVMVASSLEYLTDTSESIAIYKVESAEQEEEGVYYCNLLLIRTFKGEPPQQYGTDYYAISRKQFKNNCPVEINDKILIFFRKDDKNNRSIVHQINLDKPQEKGYMFIAATSDFELLKEKKKILK